MEVKYYYIFSRCSEVSHLFILLFSLIQTPTEQLQTYTDHLLTEVKQLKDTVQDLMERNVVMEQLIRELIQKPTAPLVAAADDNNSGQFNL